MAAVQVCKLSCIAMVWGWCVVVVVGREARARPFQPTEKRFHAAMQSYGGKYAVLTVQAGCGFDLWPSNVSFPARLGGGRYNYTVRESKYQHDLLRQFVDGARAAGVRPGIYYIVNNDVMMQKVYNATTAELEDFIIGQLREIWGSYGELVRRRPLHWDTLDLHCVLLKHLPKWAGRRSRLRV